MLSPSQSHGPSTLGGRIRECPGTTVGAAQPMGADEALGPQPNGSPGKSGSPRSEAMHCNLATGEGTQAGGGWLCLDPRADPGPSGLCSMPPPSPWLPRALPGVCISLLGERGWNLCRGPTPDGIPRRRSQNTPNVQTGRLRATGCVRAHSPGQEQEPGLKPALCPHSGDSSCTQASQGLWGGRVGLTV